MRRRWHPHASNPPSISSQLMNVVTIRWVPQIEFTGIIAPRAILVLARSPPNMFLHQGIISAARTWHQLQPAIIPIAIIPSVRSWNTTIRCAGRGDRERWRAAAGTPLLILLPTCQARRSAQDTLVPTSAIAAHLPKIQSIMHVDLACARYRSELSPFAVFDRLAACFFAHQTLADTTVLRRRTWCLHLGEGGWSGNQR